MRARVFCVGAALYGQVSQLIVISFFSFVKVVAYYYMHVHITHIACSWSSFQMSDNATCLTTSQLSQVVGLLTKTFHSLSDSRRVCMDVLESHSSILETISVQLPLAFDGFRNLTAMGNSSRDSAAVVVRWEELWVLTGVSVTLLLLVGGTCLLTGLCLGRQSKRPEVLLPNGRYWRSHLIWLKDLPQKIGDLSNYRINWAGVDRAGGRGPTFREAVAVLEPTTTGDLQVQGANPVMGPPIPMATLRPVASVDNAGDCTLEESPKFVCMRPVPHVTGSPCDCDMEVEKINTAGRRGASAFSSPPRGRGRGRGVAGRKGSPWPRATRVQGRPDTQEPVPASVSPEPSKNTQVTNL